MAQLPDLRRRAGDSDIRFATRTLLLKIADSMTKELPNASGARARNIAYALAAFGVEYERNRDYRLLLLNSCLARPKEAPENDECDGELLDFVTSLYWRGDDSLLALLLRVADTRRNVIGVIGIFYSDLLDRRGAVVFESIEKLPAEKQKLICKLAYEDDLSMNGPKRDRVIALLRGAGGDAAARCSSAFGYRYETSRVSAGLPRRPSCG
jgi:hypothetical protein